VPSRVQSFKLPCGIWSRINNHSPSGLPAPLADSCVTSNVPEGHCQYHGVWLPIGTGLTKRQDQVNNSGSHPICQDQAQSCHVPHPVRTCVPIGVRAATCPVAPGSRFLAGSGADTCLGVPRPGSMRGPSPKTTCG
jgi:hypothetical protein